jgi:prepilin-type N-terminal cleavage/methylation domain-containing protein
MRRSGFTLIELLVVIAIIAILETVQHFSSLANRRTNHRTHAHSIQHASTSHNPS